MVKYIVIQKKNFNLKNMFISIILLFINRYSFKIISTNIENKHGYQMRKTRKDKLGVWD